jgi:3-dehydroquinate synthetase
VRHSAFVCDDGEAGKTLDAVAELYRALEAVGADRDTVVVALGGGTLSDLAGFAAATFLRGLPFAVVPTTLLAQADACVGGKCGVNFEGLKNRIGAFHHPEWALVDPETLLTLPEEHFRGGFPELAKGCLLHSAEAFRALESAGGALRDRDTRTLADLVATALTVKLERAGEDPDDRRGIRAALNLGHTLGHALESVSEYDLSHGEAVAVGLLFALDLSAGPDADHPLMLPLARLLGSMNLLTGLAYLDEPEALVEAMARDKKRAGDAVRFVTLPKAGKPGFASLATADLAAALASFRGRFVVARAED